MASEQKPVDPMFDGHRELELSKLSTVEKLRYMSMQIELLHYVRTKVRRCTPPDSNENTNSDQ